MDQVIKMNKRFKPTDDSTLDSACREDGNLTFKDMLVKAKSNLEAGSNKEVLKQNVQNQLMEYMSEHDAAGHSKLQQKKQELLIIQAGKLTVTNDLV